MNRFARSSLLTLALVAAACGTGAEKKKVIGSTEPDPSTTPGPSTVTCPAGTELPTAMNASWTVKADVTAFSAADRSFTAGGRVVYLPAGLMVEVDDLPMARQISFEELTNPDKEKLASLIGGQLKATGGILPGNAEGTCVKLVAKTAQFKMEPDNITGYLQSVDLATKTVTVLEVGKTSPTVYRANTDPRFATSKYANGLDEPMPFDQLASAIGAELDVDGYYDAAKQFVGVDYNADFLPAPAGSDAVLVEDAIFSAALGTVRVSGKVSRLPSAAPGSMVTLTVYSGALDATSRKCAGTALGTAVVTFPMQGLVQDFDFTTAMATAPTAVCVLSPNGGAFGLTVELN